VVHGTAHDELFEESRLLRISQLYYGNRATLSNRSTSLRGRIVPGSQLRNLRYRLIDDKRDAVAARRVILVGPAASSLPQITRSHL